ncbi:helix-turn-helix domain-containing protein [Cetobacterium sp.]|uniref:helix-turn-helix domain-containing protein n=1 Tax=Cetobacterium sp. TaxID=2071632 RepID=UPI003F30BF69
MLCDRFKKERMKSGLNQVEFAKKFSVTKQTVSNWESGKRKPDSEMLLKIANCFGVTVDYLLGNDNCKKTDDTDLFNLKGDVRFLKKIHESEMVKIPVLGVIKAGIPMYAEENIIDYEYVHQEELMLGEETFFLEVKGDSMINARIHEGDRVRIRKQNFVETNGGIYAVNVNGDEATLKRVYVEEDGIRLISENPAYPSMFYPAKDIESGYVSIVGRAIEVKINL